MAIPYVVAGMHFYAFPQVAPRIISYAIQQLGNDRSFHWLSQHAKDRLVELTQEHLDSISEAGTMTDEAFLLEYCKEKPRSEATCSEKHALTTKCSHHWQRRTKRGPRRTRGQRTVVFYSHSIEYL